MKPFTLLKIQEMFLKWEESQYMTTSDLNTGYYNTNISEYHSKLCKIINTWGNYEYLLLTMGV